MKSKKHSLSETKIKLAGTIHVLVAVAKSIRTAMV